MSPSWTKIKDNDMLHTTKSNCATCKLGFHLIQSDPFHKQTVPPSPLHYSKQSYKRCPQNAHTVDVMSFNSAQYYIPKENQARVWGVCFWCVSILKAVRIHILCTTVYPCYDGVHINIKLLP